MKLSKKLIEEAQYRVSEDDAKLSFTEFVELWANKDINELLENSRIFYKDCTDEEIENNVRLKEICDGLLNWKARGVWRRIIRKDIGEFCKFLLMQGRQGIIDHTANDENYDSEYTDLFEVAFPLLAVRDTAGLDKYLKIATYPLDCNQTLPQIYNGLQAILRNDHSRMQIFLKHVSPKRESVAQKQLVNSLKAIIENDDSMFAESLKKYIKSYRRQFLFAYDMPFCIEAHGIYSLAQHFNPDVANLFDVEEDLPWDTALHEWVSENDATLAAADFGECPEHLFVPFLTLKRPDWFVET